MKKNIESTNQDKGNESPFASALNEISQKLDVLTQDFEDKIRYNENEGRIIEGLNSELQQYKNEMYAQLLRPLLLDIIEVRDTIIEACSREAPSIVNIAPYSALLGDILKKNYIEIFRSESGSQFIPIKHRVIKKIPVNDKLLHSRIAESFSDGYNYNGKILSAEKVAVYYYETSKESNKEGSLNG
jgi:molecular chaperone GrpE (heat shock protein)